jgi:hypothetical protein
LLQQYDEEKIRSYTNSAAAEIQKAVDLSIKDERTKEISTLAKIMSDITGADTPHELPLLLKLNASKPTEGSSKRSEVNFR